MKHTVITGGDGVVGSYIDFGMRTNRATLDVANLEQVLSFCRTHKPEVILHLASMTDLAACEQDPAKAYLVNAVGTYNVALAAREVGAKLIYVSTSAVFDGTKVGQNNEDDVPNPQGAYAHSKYLGELAVVGVLLDYCIVRVSWVFGGGPKKDKKFVAKIISQLDRPEISIIAGRRGSPTYAKDLSAVFRTIIEEDKRGIVHASSGVATRFEMAQEIAKLMGSAARIVEAPKEAFLKEAASARGGDNEGIGSRDFPLRPWQDSLAEYLQTEWSGNVNT